MATILNERDKGLQLRGLNRIMAPVVKITVASTAPTGLSYFTGGSGTAPTSLIFTANTTGIGSYTSPVFAWHYSTAADPTNWISLGISTAALTISNSSYMTHAAGGKIVNYRVTVTQAGWTSTTSTYSAGLFDVTATNGINVSLTNDSHNVPTDSVGNNPVFAASGTLVYIYEGGAQLTYDGVGTANGTFSVNAVATNMTAGALSDGGLHAIYANATAITADVATLDITATGKTTTGASFVVTKRQTLSKAKGGASNVVYDIITSSPVITKTAVDAATSGVHSSITVQGKSYIGATTANYGWVTITANGGTEATTATDTSSAPASITPANGDGKTSYTIKLYNQATVSGATLLDTEVVNVVFSGPAGMRTAAPELFQWASVAPTSYPSGTSTYTWATGVTTLPTTPNGWAVLPPAAVSGQTLWAIKQVITDTTSSATSVVTWASSTVYPAGASGGTGADGTKAITVSCFRWAASAPTVPVPSQVVSLTWPSSISAPATGWTNSAGAAVNGQSLYMLSMVVTDVASATTTNVNWNTATLGTIGFRSDGTIGGTGNSARRAYIVTGSQTPPASPTPVAGDNPPTSWSFTASVPGTNQWLHQVDGILSTNIAWGTPYLASFTVGSLSALQANIGNLSVGNPGSLYSAGKSTYNLHNTTSGFFLGWDSTHYKLNIGNDVNYMKWTGSALEVRGTLRTADSGSRVEILSADSTLKIWDGATNRLTLNNASNASDGSGYVVVNSGAFVAASFTNSSAGCSTYFSNSGTGNAVKAVSVGTGGTGTAGAFSNTGSGYGVWGSSSSSFGVYGTSGSAVGSIGVYGFGNIAVQGITAGGTSAIAIKGTAQGAGDAAAGWFHNSAGGLALNVISTGSGIGIQVASVNNSGYTASCSGPGVYAINSLVTGAGSIGVVGRQQTGSAGYGVYGVADGASSIGVLGRSSTLIGVSGEATVAAGGQGVRGYSAGGAGAFAFYATGPGGTYGPFTGAHEGLLLRDSAIEIGDIVVDQMLISKNGISNSIFHNVLSSTPMQKNVLGVVSNTPGDILCDVEALKPLSDEELTYIKATYVTTAVNALGEGQIKVCKENGNIEAGDFICTSSIPGKGMKQTSDVLHNYTVAKARESVIWADGDSSIKLAACIYLSG
jgi:hypothetical protein